MSTCEQRQYLSISEQQKVINRLKAVTSSTPLNERLLYDYGDVFAGSTLFFSSIYYWRVGFHAFNMHKYARGRLITVLVSVAQGTGAAVMHTMRNLRPLNEYYRSENRWTYGVQSLISHQVCLFCCAGMSLGHTFVNAHLNGMIPVRRNFHRAGARVEAFKYVCTKLKPYAKRMLAVNVATSALMFTLGVLEYDESCKLLAKINRKSLSWKED